MKRLVVHWSCSFREWPFSDRMPIAWTTKDFSLAMVQAWSSCSSLACCSSRKIKQHDGGLMRLKHRRSSCSCCDAIRLSYLASSFWPSAVVSTGLALVDLTWNWMCCYLCFSTRYQLWFTWAHLALKMCWLIRGAMKLSYVMRSSMLCRCSLGSDMCSKTYLCCSYASVYCLRIELSDFRSGRFVCLSL